MLLALMLLGGTSLALVSAQERNSRAVAGFGRTMGVRAPGAPIETLRSAVVWATDTDFVFLAGAPLLYARDIKVLDCAGSVCQAQIEWVPTQGLRASSLHVTF